MKKLTTITLLFILATFIALYTEQPKDECKKLYQIQQKLVNLKATQKQITTCQSYNIILK